MSLLRMQATFFPYIVVSSWSKSSSKNCAFYFGLDEKAEWEGSHGQLKVSDRLQRNRHGCENLYH
jgi:hypothetical protein